MSVTATVQGVLTVAEVLPNNTASATAPRRTVTHDQFNQTKQLTAATTPPATAVAAFEQALTAGAATIDLTALVGTNGAAVDGTGLKVQAILLINKSTNANSMTIGKGQTNGYALWGNNAVTLAPGQWIEFYGNDATPDVASGAKTLDVTGTLAQVLQVEVVLG